MPVSGIDHINILTDELEATASFYERVLGFRRAENPAIAVGIVGYWLYDSANNPIIHLVDRKSAGTRYKTYKPGAVTNALHHIAFACQGFAEIEQALMAHAIAYRANHLPEMGLRQIFLVDPNAINLELNFSGE